MFMRSSEAATRNDFIDRLICSPLQLKLKVLVDPCNFLLNGCVLVSSFMCMSRRPFGSKVL